ncbi:tyrosine-type recombinase/integrase [Thermaurantiacus tibetensis]|uniref:tyrosine-type recombinase/integrase n=1 Tax=Thermaurantiacus tibetensis TaxID=2759035 RepID=UPI00188FCDE4|nr:tyrosine-type recombinase/integrase [Thermaurantiacus tibetensis]
MTPNVSWKEAVVEWHAQARRSLAPRTVARYLASLRTVARFLENKCLAEIDAKLIRTIVAARQKEGVTNASIRRDLSAVSSVLSHAVAHEWIAANPAKAYDRSSIRERRPPIVLPDPSSLAEVLARLPEGLRDMAEFGIHTGMRLEELASLRWEQVDWHRQTVQLVQTKRGAGRVVELDAAALAVLQRRGPGIGKSYVFTQAAGTRYASPSGNFRAVVDRVARSRAARKAARNRGEPEPPPFQRFRFHDLRHLYIVTQLRAGRSIWWVKEQVGHSSVTQTEAYARVFLSPTEAARARQGTIEVTERDTLPPVIRLRDRAAD